ncbi:MAG TPA: DMT family transporter [Candidatus Angelobacter sp.]|nr:DMT family transporter [Candidatus Angelobacter sp.]
MLPAFLATILFSFSAITGRRLSGFISGTQSNLARLIFAALVLGTFSHLVGLGISGPAFPFLFLSGCVGFGIGDLSMFQAYPRIGARRTIVLIQCLAAPFGGIIEWLWLHHAPTPAQAAFGAIILAGVGIAMMPSKKEAQPAHGLTAGILFGTFSAFCQGSGAVISRKAYEVAAAAGHPFHTVTNGINAAFQRILGGILISTLFLGYLRLAHKPASNRQNDWRRGSKWVIANSMAGPALGVSCYQWALMSKQTSVVLPIVATTPLVVMPLAHYLEGDRITWRTVLGGILAVAGVIGLTLAR